MCYEIQLLSDDGLSQPNFFPNCHTTIVVQVIIALRIVLLPLLLLSVIVMHGAYEYEYVAISLKYDKLPRVGNKPGAIINAIMPY